MSDISKCAGQYPNTIVPGVSEASVCPDRQKCWRYLAPVSRAQSWIAPPWDENGCEAFLGTNAPGVGKP